MELLNGATISISFDEQTGLFTATVGVGYSSSTASNKRPELAIGQAALQQAGVSDGELKKQLAKGKKG